jgi:hypothetical protein
MNFRDAAALTLVSWYLMMPPNLAKTSWSCSGGLEGRILDAWIGSNKRMDNCIRWAKIADFDTLFQSGPRLALSIPTSSVKLSAAKIFYRKITLYSRVRRRCSNGASRAAIERAGGSVGPACYTHRSDYRLALESGKGVTEYQPFEPAANEIRSIWTWLRDELAIAKTDPDSRAAVA